MKAEGRLMEILMSRHAQEQWEIRVGGVPPLDASSLLDECVIFQKCRDYYTSRGRHCRVMGLYWHERLQVMFKVDDRAKRVVTVVSAKAREAKSGA